MYLYSLPDCGCFSVQNTISKVFKGKTHGSHSEIFAGFCVGNWSLGITKHCPDFRQKMCQIQGFCSMQRMSRYHTLLAAGLKEKKTARMVAMSIPALSIHSLFSATWLWSRMCLCSPCFSLTCFSFHEFHYNHLGKQERSDGNLGHLQESQSSHCHIPFKFSLH